MVGCLKPHSAQDQFYAMCPIHKQAKLTDHRLSSPCGLISLSGGRSPVHVPLLVDTACQFTLIPGCGLFLVV